jgi:hypothetical protein
VERWSPEDYVKAGGWAGLSASIKSVFDIFGEEQTSFGW